MTTLYDHRRWHTQFRFRGGWRHKGESHVIEQQHKPLERKRWPYTIGTYNLYILGYHFSDIFSVFSFFFSFSFLRLLYCVVEWTTPFHVSLLFLPCTLSEILFFSQHVKVQRIRSNCDYKQERKKGGPGKLLSFTIPDHVHTRLKSSWRVTIKWATLWRCKNTRGGGGKARKRKTKQNKTKKRLY